LLKNAPGQAEAIGARIASQVGLADLRARA
jgi:hypothetical protein